MTKYSQMIVLDSGETENSLNSNVTGSFSDFTVNFNRTLIIPSNVKLALMKLNTYYTWKIVSAANNNNRFQVISTTPAKTVNCVLPDGIYSVNSLNDYIYDVFRQEFGYVGNQYDMPIQFLANTSISRFVIAVSNSNYSINLSPNGSLFYVLLGWNPQTQPLLVTTTTVAGKVGNINFNIDNYLLNCDLIQTSIINNDVSKSVLYTFTPNVEIGSAIIEEPVTKIYLPVTNREFISSIRIYLTDNKGRYVELQESMVIILHLIED